MTGKRKFAILKKQSGAAYTPVQNGRWVQMTLQQLHYAITISETGSLNKAAEILYVAQPSLTGAMQELEKELGVTIFHRRDRKSTRLNSSHSGQSRMPSSA